MSWRWDSVVYDLFSSVAFILTSVNLEDIFLITELISFITEFSIFESITNKISLFETVIVTVNDYLVDLFLNKKISYNQLQNLLLKILKKKSFIKYKKLKPKKFEDIIFVKNNVSSEIVKTIKK